MTTPPSRRRVTVLVEGPSDAAAVRVLAAARGLGEDDLAVVSMGGVTNVARHLHARRAAYDEGTVVGLCDAAEERFVVGALRREGLVAQTREEMASAGFFVCEADLEEELLRALGVERVEEALRGGDELERFRTFQRQPEWRERSTLDQLHRFAGTTSGRKAALARSLAGRLEPDEVPSPLRRLLDRVALRVQ